MSGLPAFFLINPCARSLVITDRFNAPRAYTFAPAKKQLHEGLDLIALDAQGSPVAVLAAQRGVVDRVAFSPHGYGHYVRIVHAWSDQIYVTWYGHLSATSAREGQFVLAGQKIGVAGTTGFSTGVHLHLTLQHIGHGLADYTVDDVVDPEPFLRPEAFPSFSEASFVADVTIPDGTKMQPGQTFLKTWRLRNTGNTTWGTGTELVFAGGAQMGAPNQVTLAAVPVLPGQAVNVSVKLTAPAEAGRHRSTWQLCGPGGQPFPNTFYAEIAVKAVAAFDEASYVADVTVPDGTVIKPGAAFVKTWRVRNTGTTTWTPDYTLRFAADDQMGGPDSVPLPRAVKPGEIVELSVRLRAPKEAGRHRSTWKLANAAGKPFEYGQYVEVQVPRAVARAQKLDELRWLADVTVFDETVMEAGEPFVKTWRVRNSGETTWEPGYTLAFFGDERMGGPQSVPLPPAAPGDVVEVSVPLVAPDAPGLQRSTWKPRNPQGDFFEFDLYALIQVSDPAQPSPQLSELSYVADVTIPDGAALHPGEAFVKTWRVRNTGTTTWGPGFALAFFSDDQLDGPDSVPLPPIKPGDVAELSLMLTAPQEPGLHRSTWRGRDPQGRFFDCDLFALIDVVDPSQTYDMLEFLRGDGRVYELACDWIGGARQRVQTQTEGAKFYHVKHSEWEELWADEHFIYRGTDTSPGGGEVYTLTENGQYGSPWIPRKMTVGVPFQRMPQVVFRRKSDGTAVPGKTFVHVTWVALEAVHKTFTLSSGVTLKDVAVLAAYEDAGGRPQPTPFERYYYARGYGLVAWEGAIGRSVLVHEFAPGSLPSQGREMLPWL
ncbi:MAG: NBR1-Ig-like domain-containing protein [Anaerolineae bacterium]|nr:NBR1-Ig-like domain-containing protein [Anaerolineae bacterium]